MGLCAICQETLTDHAEYCPCCGANTHHEATGPAIAATRPMQQAPGDPGQEAPADSAGPRTRRMDPGAPTATLTVKRGGLPSNDVFTVGGDHSLIVGRFDPETGPVDVDLGPFPEGGYVSRHHASLTYSPTSGQWIVRDLHSRNGVFLRRDGQPHFDRVTTESEIHSGDELALGNARFEFRT